MPTAVLLNKADIIEAYKTGGANDVVLTVIPLGCLDRSIVGAMPLNTLVRIFRRALNTWEFPEQYLLDFCSQLEQIQEEQNRPKN